MLDTYSIFGCDDGEPTFRYTLEQGVKDGYLIKLPEKNILQSLKYANLIKNIIEHINNDLALDKYKDTCSAYVCIIFSMFVRYRFFF